MLKRAVHLAIFSIVLAISGCAADLKNTPAAEMNKSYISTSRVMLSRQIHSTTSAGHSGMSIGPMNIAFIQVYPSQEHKWTRMGNISSCGKSYCINDGSRQISLDPLNTSFGLIGHALNLDEQTYYFMNDNSLFVRTSGGVIAGGWHQNMEQLFRAANRASAMEKEIRKIQQEDANALRDRNISKGMGQAASALGGVAASLAQANAYQKQSEPVCRPSDVGCSMIDDPASCSALLAKPVCTYSN